MIVIRTLSLIGATVMIVAIAAAFVTGDFFTEGSDIWALPWGKVTLIDLYVALAFFGAWIAYRESSRVATVAWWLGLVLLGSLAAAIYLALASVNSQDRRELLMGEKKV